METIINDWRNLDDTNKKMEILFSKIKSNNILPQTFFDSSNLSYSAKKNYTVFSFEIPIGIYTEYLEKIKRNRNDPQKVYDYVRDFTLNDIKSIIIDIILGNSLFETVELIGYDIDFDNMITVTQTYNIVKAKITFTLK